MIVSTIHTFTLPRGGEEKYRGFVYLKSRLPLDTLKKWADRFGSRDRVPATTALT